MNYATISTPLWLLSWLMRLDVAAFFLMLVVSVILTVELVENLLNGVWDRAVQLLAGVALLAVIEAVEALFLGLTRATLISVLDGAWLLNSAGRLLVPGIGAAAGLGFVAWLDRGRWFLLLPCLAVTAVILVWEMPTLWLMTQFYYVLNWVHHRF